MPSVEGNDLVPNPIRTGAAPTIDIVAAGLDEHKLWQPAWIRMTEVLVKWIRFHFSAASRIEHPDLIDRVWIDNPDTSPIMISSLAEFAPRSSGQRPAILVDRLDQDKDMQHRAIGDQFQGGRPGQFSHIMQGQHVVHCLGGRDGETEILAFEVWRDLTRFAPVLRDRLCLMRLLPVKIGKRIKIDEYNEHYSLPIVIAYAYQEAWRTYPTDEAEITAIKTALAGL